ncbi:MAG: DUF11 domain-containing protein [Planctomycetaceae bacterium]
MFRIKLHASAWLPLSLLTLTGCASMLGTQYHEEKAPSDSRTAEHHHSEFDDRALSKGQQPTTSDDSTSQASQGRYPQPSAARKDLLTTPEFDPSAAATSDVRPPLLDADAAWWKHAKSEESVPEASTQDSAATEPNPFAAFEAAERQAAASPGKIQQTGFSTESGPGIAMTSGAWTNASSNARAASATTFREAEPRLPGSDPWCPPSESVTVAATSQAAAYPDEYIFDGGDRDIPVHYEGGEMAGLDSEDTVAEYQDHSGKTRVKASNRVAVYAPRFGAVETITGPGIDIKVDKAAGAMDVSGLDALHEDRGPGANIASTPVSGVGARAGASGIEIAQPAFMNEKADIFAQNTKVDQGLEAKTARGMGILEVTDAFELNLQILEPITSNLQTRPGQRASTSQATQTYATYRVHAFVGSEEGGQPGEIHITKEASPLIAKAGDEITFTIHFRNTGDYNIQQVRIIDNLTPRLIYVEGTGRIDLPGDGTGDLTVVPNKDGGQTLQFELEEPLKGGVSGTITFKATVR